MHTWSSRVSTYSVGKVGTWIWRMMHAGVPSSLGRGVGGWSCSNFLASTIPKALSTVIAHTSSPKSAYSNPFEASPLGVLP